MHIRAFIVAMWAISIGGSAMAASPLPSFAADSDQIRASRPLAQEDALVFDYRIDVSSPGKPDVVDTGQVTIADDFVAVAGKDASLLDDYTLCRVFSWSPGKPMQNESCYAGPAFRDREQDNRRRMKAAVEVLASRSKALHVPLSMKNPYWAEQELGSRKPGSDPLVPSKSKDGVDWRLSDSIVVNTSSKGLAFSAAERPRIARYLARHVDLHPQVRQAILDDGMLPERIDIVRLRGDVESREVLTYTNFSHAKVAYPLPAGLKSLTQLRALDSTLTGMGLKRALEVVTNKTSDTPPTLDQLIGQMDAASAANQPLTVMLLFMNMNQQYGSDLMSDPASMAKFDVVKPEIRTAMTDTAAVELMAANDVSGNNQQGPARAKAAQYWASAKNFDSLPFGTFRFVSYANLMRRSGDVLLWDPSIAKSMPTIVECYWKHIAAYPWAGNAFKDLGDSYLEEFDTPNAWLAWDLGRAIDGNAPSSLLTAVDKYEQNLRRGLPDNF